MKQYYENGHGFLFGSVETTIGKGHLFSWTQNASDYWPVDPRWAPLRGFYNET